MAKRNKKQESNDVTKFGIVFPAWVLGKEGKHPRTVGQRAATIRRLKSAIMLRKDLPRHVKGALITALAKAVCREHLAGHFSFGTFAKLRRETLSTAAMFDLNVPFPTSHQLESTGG